MEDKIKNIQKMLKRSPQKGLVLLKDFLQNDFKQISASERKKLYSKIKELEKIAFLAWQEMYSPTTTGQDPLLKEVSNQVAEGARKIFDKSGLKYDPIKVMNRALEMIIEGNTEKATALIMTTCRAATHKAETIVRTIQIGKNRAAAFDKAVKSGVEKFKYVGASAGIRPFCKDNLNKVFTLKEIEKMDNEQGLSVRFSCGGYNCRHRWVAVLSGEISYEKDAKPKQHEIETAKKLNEHGYNVKFVKESTIKGQKMYDAILNGNEKAEFKSAKNVDNQRNHLAKCLKLTSEKRASVLVLDVTMQGYDSKLASEDASEIKIRFGYKEVKKIIILENNSLITTNLKDLQNDKI